MIISKVTFETTSLRKKYTMSNRLANVVIAGVNKAGTTSLFTYLISHPDVCGSIDKETCYFLPIRYGQQPEPLEKYEWQFSKCDDKKINLEATPGYFYGGKDLAQYMKTCLGNPKVIIIFRDPVYRLISFYNRKKQILINDLPTLWDYIKACENMPPEKLKLEENNLYTGVECGFYSDFVQDWFDVFGDNLKIMFFDDLRDTKSFLKDVCKFIDIDGSFYEKFQFTVENKSVNYKNKILHNIALFSHQSGKRFWRNFPATKRALRELYYKINGKAFKSQDEQNSVDYLQKLYKPYNAKLSAILEQNGITKLPTWLS